MIGKKLSAKYDSWNLNFFYSYWIGNCFPILGFFDWSYLINNNLNLLLWVFLYGAMIFGFGNYFFMKSMNYLEAGDIMIFANFEPVLSVIFTSLILAEKLMLLQIIGFIFILTAIFLIAKTDELTCIALEG